MVDREDQKVDHGKAVVVVEAASVVLAVVLAEVVPVGVALVDQDSKICRS